MEKVWVLLLKAFKLGEKTYKEGDLVEVDKEVADVLIEKAIAEAKTVEEHIADGIAQGEKDAATERDAEEAARAAKLETAVVTRVHERLADDPTGGYSCYAAFARDVARACNPTRPIPPKKLIDWDRVAKLAPHGKTGEMQEGDDEQGGFLVPTQFIAKLLKITLEASIVRERAQYIPMQTNSVSMPAVNVSTHATTFFGGITVYRPAELGSKVISKPDLGLVTLTLHKLIVMCQVTDELLEDSPISIEPILTDMAGQAIAAQYDEDFLMGTGVNMAVGCLNVANPSLIQESRNLAGAIRYDDIVDMWTRLWPAAHGRAIWVCSISAQGDLMRMVFPTAGTPIPVYLPAGGLSAMPYATLMGRPLLVTEKLPVLGTMGDIGLIDLTQYMIGGKSAGLVPKADVSMHLYFAYDAQAFRYVLRYDGQPWWLSDIVPQGGGATYSPFVVLSDTVFETTTTTAAATTTTGA